MAGVMEPVTSGSRLGPYEIVALLGEGGMGQVWRARDVRLGRAVAIKVLRKGAASEAELRRRFEREARAASALNHPHIVTVHDIGNQDGVDYIVTELVEGATLGGLLAEGPLPPERALEIAIPIAAALAAAHAAGIVHRDLKPENVMVTAAGHVKILDFGLAKIAPIPLIADPLTPTKPLTAPAPPDATTRGVIIGTVEYMSPEQARGDVMDFRTDQFSFGSILYEMLTGRAPFERGNLVLTLTAILTEEPEPLAELCPAAPPALRAIVSRCLEKDPAARYGRTDELRDALRASARVETSPAIPKRVWTPPRPPLAAAPRRRSSRRLLVYLGIGAIAAWLVANSFLATHRRLSTGPPGTLAIVPFVNETKDSALDYLGDGIPQEVLDRLGASAAHRVKAWGAVERYRDRAADPQAIGRALGVRAVVGGRIVRHDNGLTLSVELVDVADGTRLWGNSYALQPSDTRAMGEEIAKGVSQGLGVPLQGSPSRIAASPEAHEEYLKGRYHWNKRTGGSIETAISCFHRAVERDPVYAKAYAGLADCYALLGYYGYRAPKDSYPDAKAQAAKALELDPELCEAHTSLGDIRMYWDWDFAAAEKEYRAALRLDPGYPTAHSWYATYLAAMGRFDEARAEAARAKGLDPLSQPIAMTSFVVEYLARRYDAAIAQGRSALDMDPTFPNHHLFMGLALLGKGDSGEAVAEIERARALAPASPDIGAELAFALAGAGRTAEARAILSKLEDAARTHYVSSFDLALVHAGLGEKDEAFALLDRATEERSRLLVFLAVDPTVDTLRDDPRFLGLLRRVGLEAVSARTASRS